MPLGTEVGLGPDDTLLDGDPAPPSQKGLGRSPIFGPCLLWPNGWIDQGGAWHGGRRWSGHIVLDGEPPPLHKREQSPQFAAYFYCGQTAGCMKMPLGMEVGLSPDHFVLDWDYMGTQPLPKKGRSPPIFGPRLL